MNHAPDPVPALKQQLGRALRDRLDTYGQCTIARWLGVDQSRVSNLLHGHLERFSLQQLIRFAARVEGQVALGVTWTTPIASINARRIRRHAAATRVRTRPTRV